MMPQADRREGALDWVGRSQVAPVLGWKVIEPQKGVSILREAGARRFVLGAILLVLPGFQWQGSRGLRSSLPQKNRIRVL